MTIQLVVVRPFGTYVKGDVIGDAASIAAVLASEQAANVVRVQQPSSSAQPGKGGYRCRSSSRGA